MIRNLCIFTNDANESTAGFCFLGLSGIDRTDSSRPMAESRKCHWVLAKRNILELRLPRVLSALIGGIALGWSGLMMQTLFRNPLAGPFLIGITPGATFGVALTTYLGSSLGLNETLSHIAIQPLAALGEPSSYFPYNSHSIKNSPKCIPSSSWD